jgi:hypothetical protein
MVHNLVRFNLKWVRLGLSQNGVDHIQHTTRLLQIGYLEQLQQQSSTPNKILFNT